jgi:hypothetical protein
MAEGNAWNLHFFCGRAETNMEFSACYPHLCYDTEELIAAKIWSPAPTPLNVAAAISAAVATEKNETGTDSTLEIVRLHHIISLCKKTSSLTLSNNSCQCQILFIH